MRAVGPAAALLLMALAVAGSVAAHLPGAADGGAPATPAPAVSLYNVSFSGHLPSGKFWTVHLGAAVQTTTAGTIVFAVANGTYTYRIAGPPGYNASVPIGNLTVAGKSLLVPVTWVTHLSEVQFTETGLPKGSTWHVFLNYSNLLQNQSVPIVFHAPNGTFPYTVGADVPWVPNPLNGVAVVNGGDVNISVTFTAPAARYTVSFSESGLPSGTLWTYSLQGAVHTAVAPNPVSQLIANGSYGYTVSPTGTYLPHPGGGTVVIQGADVSVTVVFTPPETFSAVFTEHGLSGVAWYVALGAPSLNLSAAGGAPITFLLPNGTYEFTPGTAARGWEATTPGGAFLVTGVNQTVATIGFTGNGTGWVVKFVPYGIGTANWWVAIGTSTWNGTGGTPVAITLFNGSYLWTAGGSGGLFPHPPGGILTVEGAPAVVDLVFSAEATASAPSGLAATFGTQLLVAGLVVVAAVVVVILLLVGRRARPPAPDPSPPPSPSDGGSHGPK